MIKDVDFVVCSIIRPTVLLSPTHYPDKDSHELVGEFLCREVPMKASSRERLQRFDDILVRMCNM
ncbi:hypothetical protein IEQ34_017581 [Dendrobium chrysotoxum]|uniref:Uncharacterized protein n=1 Tax=Dendrobium chrysotoxum TaxID=161865 RepID=A0AAV7GCI2_DENCH|nr:hypothetical protein IEQ34_017581 [Dendrobium chrysotoxum]